MQTINAGIKQSVFDLALQHTGSVEAAMEIATLNNISVDAELLSGQELNVGDVRNRMIVKIYKDNNINPSTALTQVLEGVDYWIINDDFIVQ